MSRYTGGNDGHQLKPVRQLKKLKNLVGILENLSNPDRSQSEVMQSEKQILGGRADGLAVLQMVIGTLPVQEYRDQDSSILEDGGITGEPGKLVLRSCSQTRAKRQGWLFKPDGAQDAAVSACIKMLRSTDASKNALCFVSRQWPG